MTTYSYDGNGNILTRNDANNHTTTFTYDAANELASKVSPAGQRWTYTYDANGNRVSLVDANGNATQTAGDGTTTYTYDHSNRLKTVGYSDATPGVTYSYDANGNRTSMVDGAGTLSYAYDALNRETNLTRGSDTFSYTYDASGNVSSRTYPDGTLVSSSFDEDNRLVSVTSGGATTNYSYDVAGNQIQTTLPAGNGYVETRTYDRAGRLIDVKNAAGGSTLSEFAYTLDPVGNPTVVAQTGTFSSTATYGYDANDRVTSVCFQTSCPGSTDPFIRWTYDHGGNRLTESRPTGTTNYTYDAADELTAAGATTYSYDHNGNEVAAGSRTFIYDLANRLTSTTSGSTTTNYAYDGDGNRLQSATGSGPSQITNYLWDQKTEVPELVIERDSAGALARRYVYGTRRISMTSGGTAYYYHYDGVGSVANLTSSTGALDWSYSYEPFGTLHSEVQGDPNAPLNPMKFGSEYSDGIGINLRAREYDPSSGRFLQIDPAPGCTSTAAMSAYVYVADRPSVLMDPTGMTFEPSSLGESMALFSTSPEAIASNQGGTIAPCNGTSRKLYGRWSGQVTHLGNDRAALAWGYQLTKVARAFLADPYVLFSGFTMVDRYPINNVQPHFELNNYVFHSSINRYHRIGGSRLRQLHVGDVVDLWIRVDSSQTYVISYIRCKVG